ncbi:MAG: hypothetical protein U0168_10025 [Nannocystaceae bacterium]
MGLRQAARECFTRLVEHDRARLGEVAPLMPLEPQRRPQWHASTGFAVVLLALIALGIGALLLAVGVPPLAFALVPLVGAWLWVRDRRRRLGPARTPAALGARRPDGE